MAIINQIVKELAGAEDLLLGQGNVTQTRAGTTIAISKINAGNLPFSGDVVTNDLVTIAAQLNTLDTSKSPTGNLALTVTGGSITLTAVQFANLSFDISGVLTANSVITIPDGYPQAIIVDNRTTGAFTLTFKNATTPGILIKQGSSALLYTTGITCETVAQTAIVNAIDVVNVPAGLITETTVQGALNGLEARKLDTAAATTQFTGAIIMAGLGTVPVGYLECNGLAVSRITYANLFSQIGIVYGNGDGATTFNIPDLRGEFVRGWDHGRGIDIGRGLGTHQLDALKSLPWSGGNWGVSNGLANVGVLGSMGAIEIRPRNVTVMFVIKT